MNDRTIHVQCEPLVEHTPDVIGGRARVSGTRIPVWILEEDRRAGWTDEAIVSNYPHALTVEKLQAIFLWAQVHKDEIDQDIRDQATE